jgi:hypothetical protein
MPARFIRAYDRGTTDYHARRACRSLAVPFVYISAPRSRQAGSKVRPGVEFRAKDTWHRLGGVTVNEPSNDSPADGIAGAMDSVRNRPTFLRVMLVLAATVVVLVGMRLAAPVLNTVLFAVVLTLLVSPVYS